MRRLSLLSLILFSAALLLSAVVATGAVTVSQSGWSWGNPTPQGNTLVALDFVQGRGYAAGEAGTALRTDDAGATWTGLATGTPVDLAELQVVDADTIVVLGAGGCVLRRSDDAGKTFRKIFIVAEQNCPAPVLTFTFVNEQVGYLFLGDGSVLRTSDAGATFARQTAVPTTPASNNSSGGKPAEIAFTGPETGIVFVTPSSNGPSLAFSSSDGGNSWKPIDDLPRAYVSRVQFLDSLNGYAVGRDTLLATTDGGKTWTAKAAGSGHDLRSIRCSDRTTCLLSTVKGDVLLKTTDGGDTATEITPSSQPIYAAAFASSSRVTAVGSNGATVISDDGGQNYTPISRDIAGQYSSLRAGPGNSAFALGLKGSLAVTTDGGSNWKTLAIPTSSDVKDLSFPSAQTGYALDAKGGLFKTTNAGTTWQTLDTGSTSAPAALAAPADDTLVLVGPTGIRRAVGTGAFEPVGPSSSRSSLDQVVAHPGLLIAAGAGRPRFFLSTDNGATWTAIRVPRKGLVGPGNAVDFVTPEVGYVIDAKRRLWKTVNGGVSWTDLVGIASEPVGISMGSTTEGFLLTRPFAAPDSAHVLRTSDGGKTWRPQAIARGAMRAVVAGGALQGYALVGDNRLFFTGMGGDAGVATALEVSTTRKTLTAKQIRKLKGRVTVRGTLMGAVGGEQIVVSRRSAAGEWTHQTVTAGANGGRFTTSWALRRSAVFVAQWAGDSNRRGAGSAPLKITVKPTPKKKRRR